MSIFKAQGTLSKRRQKDYKSQKVREFAVRLCFLVTSEATPLMSHQHDSFNMSLTRIESMAVPAGKGKAHKTSTLLKRTPVN